MTTEQELFDLSYEDLKPNHLYKTNYSFLESKYFWLLKIEEDFPEQYLVDVLTKDGIKTDFILSYRRQFRMIK